MKPLTLEDPTVFKFYENTFIAWTSGNITFPGKQPKQVKDVYKNKKYNPKKNVLLKKYFQEWEPRSSEFFLTIAEKDFLLTNHRIFLNDRKSKQYIPIELSMIQGFEAEGKWTKTCTFQLSNGEKVVIEKMNFSPTEPWLNSFLEMKVWEWEDGKPKS